LIGVDEVSYGADHKFLTCVADHKEGSIVWATEGRNAASLQAFFDGLTPEQKASIRAVSIDMSAGYRKRSRCSLALEGSRTPSLLRPVPRRPARLKGSRPGPRAEYNQHGRSAPRQGSGSRARATACSRPRQADARQLLKLAEVVLTNKRMYRAFLLYGELRYIYRLPSTKPRAPRRVARIGLPLEAQTVRQARPHDPQTQAGVLAAVELGLSNERLEP